LVETLIGTGGWSYFNVPDDRLRAYSKAFKTVEVNSTIFAVGALVGLFEFPCTGGIYIAILSMLAIRTTFLEGVMYLLVYNVAFVLPLIAIIVFASKKEVRDFSLRRWQQHGAKHMELLESLIYLGLGAFLLISRFL